jgi:hypothetical protein
VKPAALYAVLLFSALRSSEQQCLMDRTTTS